MNKQIILSDLSAYWDELRGHRLAPRRSDLNPNRFGAALEHMFILETCADGPLRIRLAGTRLCDMMGMEARGMPARAIFAQPDQLRADELLREVVRNPACIDITLNGDCEDGTTYAGAMILRPLADDFGAVTRVLGCIVIDTPQFAPDIQISLGAVRIDTLRDVVRVAAPTGFAEAQTPFDGPHLRAVTQSPSIEMPKRKPLSRDHLRVVSSRE